MGDVVQFPKRAAIFSESMRSRIVANLPDLTDKPGEVVDRVESEICTELVSVTREFASAAAESLGNWIADKVFKK